MIRASALYMAIVMSLVIGLICSSLLLLAYFYKSQYLRKARMDRLQHNLVSGINILETTTDTVYRQGKTFSLFEGENDSVRLKAIPWGIFDVNVAESFKQRDTLYKVFTNAYVIDSLKWAAIYLPDQDRPLSLSGKTAINGDVFIPVAGIRTAYVDNKAYEGDKRLIVGKTRNSGRTLPPLNENRLRSLQKMQEYQINGKIPEVKRDINYQSFRLDTRFLKINNDAAILHDVSLKGNIIVYADTLLTIDSTANLEDVIVIAKSILVKSGFRGKCQLFATDSIGIEKHCVFTYPSAIGVLRFKTPVVSVTQSISIGEGTVLNGCVFSYEKEAAGSPGIITLNKNLRINGQVYAQHILQTRDGLKVRGSIFAGSFMYQNDFTRYENYLINLEVSESGLSRYYLTSGLLPVAAKKRKVLQWLEVK